MGCVDINQIIWMCLSTASITQGRTHKTGAASGSRISLCCPLEPPAVTTGTSFSHCHTLTPSVSLTWTQKDWKVKELIERLRASLLDMNSTAKKESPCLQCRVFVCVRIRVCVCLHFCNKDTKQFINTWVVVLLSFYYTRLWFWTSYLISALLSCCIHGMCAWTIVSPGFVQL